MATTEHPSLVMFWLVLLSRPIRNEPLGVQNVVILVIIVGREVVLTRGYEV